MEITSYSVKIKLDIEGIDIMKSVLITIACRLSEYPLTFVRGRFTVA